MNLIPYHRCPDFYQVLAQFYESADKILVDPIVSQSKQVKAPRINRMNWYFIIISFVNLIILKSVSYIYGTVDME